MLAVLTGPYEKRLSLREEAISEFGGSVEELQDATAGDLAERAADSSLFGEKHAYLVRGALALEDETILETIPSLIESENLFILEEEKLTADISKRLKKEGVKILEGKKEEPKERLNTFALADALGVRDKKKAWVLLVEFLREGAKPEELVGVLHWQARSMLLASRAKTAEEVKMKDFVFNKSKRYAKNFKEGELEKLSRDIVVLYHESHRGAGPLELLLERFVLSL